MNGADLATFMQELNGGASIGDTLALQLLNLSKAMVEQRRPWMILRDTDTSIAATAATNGWQTAVDLSTITRFNRFYGDFPVKNFDGNNRTDYYRQIPWQKRLQYREAAFTFAFNEGTKSLYLNGTVNPGTLWIDHIKDSADIAADTSWVFPSWAHPLLGFFAVGIHKGGIDYDDVNARMSADNRATAATILAQLETWDNEKQLAAQEQHDPTGGSDGWRPGAIDISA